MAPVKVLHIIQGFGPGGAETWLLAAVKYLRQHPELNLQFDFLATGGEKLLFDDEVAAQGCKIFYHKYSLKKFFQFRKQIKKILTANSYTAIHNHQDFIAGWHFLAAGSELPAMRITHLHNPYNFVYNYVTNPARWFSFKAGRWLMQRYTTKITGTSAAVMDEYGYNKQPYVRKRVTPAYCGFDVTNFTFQAAAKKEICNEFNWDAAEINIGLFTGRIGLQAYDTAKNQKNPEFAFAIAKELVIKNNKWRFILAGYKGNLGAEMENELLQLNLQHKIILAGFRNDIPVLMSAASVLLFPSEWEGLGMVAVEAQANGLPVLMSDTVPAEAIIFPEIVLKKKLSDGKKSWADTIDALVNKTAANDRVTFAEKTISSPFSIQSSVAGLIKLYKA